MQMDGENCFDNYYLTFTYKATEFQSVL